MALALPTSTPMATSTPMPTLQATQAGAWYQNPTPIPSLTPTPQGTIVFPVLRTINEQEDGKDSSGTSDQPLLPLAAAALGTSVLLAAASRREEKQNLVGETAPPAKVSTLAMLAGVVKESFDGIWNEAVRISPADAPTVTVTTYYVGTEDPAEYLQRQAAMGAVVSQKGSTGSAGAAGKVIKKPSVSTTTTYQDYLYGTSTTKGVIGTSTGTTNSGKKKTPSVTNAKSTTTSTSSAAKTSSSTKATTTTSSGGVLNWISDTAKSVVNTVKSVVTTVAAAIPSTTTKVIDYVKEKSNQYIIPPVLSGVGYVSDGVKSIQSGIHTMSEAIQSIPEVIENKVVDPFLNFCRTIPDFVVTKIADPMDQFEENMTDDSSTLSDFVKTDVADPLEDYSVSSGFESKAKEVLAFLQDFSKNPYKYTKPYIVDPISKAINKIVMDWQKFNEIRKFIPGILPIDPKEIEILLIQTPVFNAGVFANSECNILGTGENLATKDGFVLNLGDILEYTQNSTGYNVTVYAPNYRYLQEVVQEGLDIDSNYMFSYSIDRSPGFWGTILEMKMGTQTEYTSDTFQTNIENGIKIKGNYWGMVAVPVLLVLGIGAFSMTGNSDLATQPLRMFPVTP